MREQPHVKSLGEIQISRSEFQIWKEIKRKEENKIANVNPQQRYLFVRTVGLLMFIITSSDTSQDGVKLDAFHASNLKQETGCAYA